MRVGEDAAERRRIADETLDAAAAWERDRVQAEVRLLISRFPKRRVR